MKKMKRNWERLRPHATVDRAVIERMLAPAFPDCSVEGYELRGTGLANSNYRVMVGWPGTEPQPVLLRIYLRDPAALDKEAAIARRFAGTLPVPEVLFTGDAPAGRYALYRWVDGVLADEVVEGGGADDVAVVARVCGEALAAIQAQRFPAPGFFGPDLAVEAGVLGPGDYVAWMRTYMFEKGAAEVLGDAAARRLSSLVEEGAPLLAAVQDDASLVHCDFNGANILVQRQPRNGAWEVAAVLDWEFACSCSSLIDVGNMLRHFSAESEAFERPFMAGFTASGGKLPPEWRRVADLYDLMSLCGFLANPEAGERIKRDVVGLVHATLARWGG